MNMTARLAPIAVMLAIALGLIVTRCTAPEPIRPSVVFTNTVSSAG